MVNSLEWYPVIAGPHAILSVEFGCINAMTISALLTTSLSNQPQEMWVNYYFINLKCINELGFFWLEVLKPIPDN